MGLFYISLFLLVRSVYFHNGSSARKSAKFPSRRHFPFGDGGTECTKRDTLAEGRPRFSGLRREGNKRGVIELSRLCVRASALRKREREGTATSAKNQRMDFVSTRTTGVFYIGVCRRRSIVTLPLLSLRLSAAVDEWAAHSCVDNDPQNYHTLPGQLTTVLPHVERFQRFQCLLPYEFPPFLAPAALLDGRGGHFGPSGWRLSFHISITSVAFCIWTRVWSLPLL